MLPHPARESEPLPRDVRVGREVYRWLRGVCLASAVLVLGACSNQTRQPPPFEVHSARILSSYHFGTPLTGLAAGDAGKIDFQNPLELHVSCFALERYNCIFLPLVASQANLVTARLSSQAVLPTTSLTSNARVEWILGTVNPAHAVVLANPARFYSLRQTQSVLAPGISATFRAVEIGGIADHTLGRPEPRYLQLDVGLLPATPGEDQTLQVALAMQDNPPNDPNNPGYPPGVYQREVAILEHSLVKPPMTLLLIVPFSFVGPPNHAVGICLSVTPPGPGIAAVVAQCKTELAAPQAPEAGPLWTLGLHRALTELDDPDRRRAALVFLAEQGDASICLDVAMLADDSLLQTIANSVKRDTPAAIESADIRNYAWVLDRSAVQALQPGLTKSDLPPEMISILTQHFGEPGRHSAAVDDIMHSSSSEQDLEARLVGENYIYLEDSSPSSRVRAFDWLNARKVAPPGFDPLGSPKARRLALDAALDGGAQ